ncbi:hypothetical protein [Histophilus somni]|nr:hypothetical protein [Histophilus somni]QQF76668.1 hypothetical protein JFL52_07505 [Histophilus somni]QQF90573.1 hypothetical protein JFL57_07510 [Histophilus somni]
MATTICSKCGCVCPIIFRWTREDPKTGAIIRAKHRPMPIPLCGCK